MSKKPTKEKLAEYAEKIRESLEFRGQDQLFALAVKAGHLAALADGAVDEDEREALVAAVDVLSQGTVIELEVEALVDEVDGAEGSLADKATRVGKELGKEHGEAGLLLAAFVAQATAGIDAEERKVLTAVGKAAGLSKGTIKKTLEAVGAEGADEEA